jgi:hypothetical protein
VKQWLANDWVSPVHDEKTDQSPDEIDQKPFLPELFGKLGQFSSSFMSVSR